MQQVITATFDSIRRGRGVVLGFIGRGRGRRQAKGSDIEDTLGDVPLGTSGIDRAVEKSERDIDDGVRRFAPLFSGDEKAALDYLGCVIVGRCPYCGVSICDASTVPAATDHEAWSKLAVAWYQNVAQHTGDCEWVPTGNYQWVTVQTDDDLAWPLLQNQDRPNEEGRSLDSLPEA